MAQADGVFDIGDAVTIEGRFTRRADHTPIVPDEVSCAVLLPDGTVATLDASEADDVWSAIFESTTDGDHVIRMAGTAPAQVATEIVITVRPRRVGEPTP
jgi:hypothetical protein